jgi:hypothetical protein
MLSFWISRRYPLRERFNTGQSLKNLLVNEAGLPCDLPQVEVEIATDYGLTTRLRFFYDTGADLMVIPIYVADHEGIRFRKDYRGTLGSSMGGTVDCFYDFVRVRSSLSGRTHRWVCAFADNLKTHPIIGRAGFLQDFAACIRRGHLVVSHPVSLRRFLTHHLARLRAGPPFGDEWEPI